MMRVSQVDHLMAIEEKYRATVDENYRLYNEVQDLKGNIRVFCRVRPLGATGDTSAGAHLQPTVSRSVSIT